MNKDVRSGFIVEMLKPRLSALMFVSVMTLYYFFFPALVSLQSSDNKYLYQLIFLCLISQVGVIVGQSIFYFDGQIVRGKKIYVDEAIFLKYSIYFFVVFSIYSLLTAPSIPLFSLLQGASPEQLSIERGDFFKTREGFEQILGYISAFITNLLMPYVLCLLFYRNYKVKYLVFMLFMLYCFSFLQKALFFTAVLPLLVLYARLNILSASKLFFAVSMAVSVLLLVVIATSEDSLSSAANSTMMDYLRADYLPANGFDYFIWRAVYIPIVSAIDTLIVHQSFFSGNNLLGASSTLISSIFGMERINIEAAVFEYQFGGWSDIGSANAVYFVDAYVNFGYAGVFVMSILIGLYLRWFRITNDVALSSMWLLFAYHLFNATFIGLMFSNGYILLVFLLFFVKIYPVK